MARSAFGQDANTFVRCLPRRQGDSNPGVLQMQRTAVVVAALLAFSVQAEARPHHTLHRVGYFQRSMTVPAGDERIVGARPSGCPNAFCGCEASLYKFGRIIPELNLASNWRRFP